jgi:hypothetical protein
MCAGSVVVKEHQSLFAIKTAIAEAAMVLPTPAHCHDKPVLLIFTKLLC